MPNDAENTCGPVCPVCGVLLASDHDCSASENSPIYSKFPEERPNPEGTQLYGISCNEGWRLSIVCSGMYEWAADWLLEVLGRRPYAPHWRPAAPTSGESK